MQNFIYVKEYQNERIYLKITMQTGDVDDTH